ncbi:MAG TPA: hypothetical protein VJ890_10920 [Vineibacter sp.]|nr:hypothetical protein [Vineibacter sp.]
MAVALLGVAVSAAANAEHLIDDGAKAMVAAPPRTLTPGNRIDLDRPRPVDAGGVLLGAAEIATGAGPAALPAAGPMARPLKLNTGPDGLDAKVRRAELANDEGWRNGTGGTAPSPTDLRNLPGTSGDLSSGGATPVISARDRGGVVGFQYKINPR